MRDGVKFLVLHYLCHVPYGSGLMLRWTDNLSRYRNVEKKLQEVHRIMQYIEIMNIDAFQLLREYDNDDVVFYLDPPHIVLSNKYYRLSFTYAQHVRLRRMLEGIEAKVLLKLEPHDLRFYNLPWRMVKRKYNANTKPGVKRTTNTYYFLMNYEVGLLVPLLHTPS